MDPDALLDRPEWAPTWIPSIDDFRQRRRLRWLVLAVLFAGLAACVVRGADAPDDPVLSAEAPAGRDDGGDAGGLVADFGAVLAQVVTASGQLLELCLLHADTPEERGRGLMGVTDLQGHDGMLFANDDPVEHQFFMFDTPMPLDITWWGPDGLFVGGTRMTPCLADDPAMCERHGPPAPYQWAIEVPAGAFDDVGIGPGSTLAVGGACTAQ